MIKTYLDESGIHADAAVCTVVGYAATWKHWKNFIPAWNKVLNRFGLGEVGFHAKDFFNRRGTTYKGWTDQQTTTCFNELVGIVNGIKPVPVGGCVIVDI